MDTRKTIRTHEHGQDDDQEGTSQQASDGESEVVPTLQHSSRTPDTPLQLGDGLQDAHSRLAEFLLAAASILAEITTSGGGRAGAREENWRQTPARASTAPQRKDWRQNQPPATDTEIGAILPPSSLTGGNREHHVREEFQSPPPTSSVRDRCCHDQPMEGAAISLCDGAAREHQQPGEGQAFQQRLPALTAF
ncbi:unnamed protein product [Lampetra planeri]